MPERPGQHTLAEMGVTELHTELFSRSTPDNGFDLLWSMLTGPGIWHPAESTLAADAVTELRRCYAARFEDYAAPNGTDIVPVHPLPLVGTHLTRIREYRT